MTERPLAADLAVGSKGLRDLPNIKKMGSKVQVKDYMYNMDTFQNNCAASKKTDTQEYIIRMYASICISF